MSTTEGYVATAEGIRLFFQKIGNGRDVVIVPNAAYMFADFKYLAGEHTVIFYDLRNRGRSDSVEDPAKLRGGVHNDVEDLEAIRQHFEAGPVGLIGHSYLGFVVALYAMKYSAHVRRVVQIGSAPPFAAKQYPPELTDADALAAEVGGKIAALQKEGPSGDPNEFRAKLWSLMRQLYVANPADAGKISWSVGHLTNEALPQLMSYYAGYLSPSMQNTKLSAQDFARGTMPVLTIHGRGDRHAPYGGGQDWVRLLPNARLVTIENAAHLPWIEAPEQVFGSIKTFLNNSWPESAETPAV
jgi:pimeloyl-ACP methyl ester carboxylesterase